MLSKIHSLLVAASLIGFACAPGPASSQVPSSNPPYNSDIGALITTTIGQPATGTVTSATQTNLDKVGVVCTYAQTASSGSPSTTMSIQSYDAATASWNTMLSTAAIANPTSGAPYAAELRSGVAVSSLPTNMVAQSLALPRTWRVQTVTTGSQASITAKVGCNLLK